MIHSLAGGNLKEQQIVDLVKVEFIDTPNQTFWYISQIADLKVGDIVFAPFGIIDELKKAKVVKIDKNVNSQNTTLNISRLKCLQKTNI